MYVRPLVYPRPVCSFDCLLTTVYPAATLLLLPGLLLARARPHLSHAHSSAILFCTYSCYCVAIKEL